MKIEGEMIQVVDTDERIRAALPMVEEMVKGGLITIQDLEVIAYRTGAEAE